MLAVSALALHLTWHSCPPLPEARAGMLATVLKATLRKATLLKDRPVYAGGSYWENGTKRWSRRCDSFDMRKQQWVACEPLPSSRADSAAVALEGRTIFLGGTSEGRVLRDVVSFDGRHWKDEPALRLPAPRAYAQAARQGDRLFFFGGLTSAGDPATATGQVWMLNLKTPANGWQTVAQLPEPVRCLNAFTSDAEAAYFLGGVRSLGKSIENRREIWRYHFTENRWSQLPDLPEASRAGSAVRVAEGLLYLGGYTDAFSRKVILLRLPERTMEVIGELPGGVADSRFVQVGGRLFFAGGESGIKIRTAQAWEGIRTKE